jgi:hypothetical protein
MITQMYQILAEPTAAVQTTSVLLQLLAIMIQDALNV